MKFAAVFGALAAVALVNPANAILIDGFGDTNPGATADAGTPVITYSDTVTDTQLAGPVERTVTTTFLDGIGVSSKITGVSSFLNSNTFFEHSQDTLSTGTSLIEWDFPPAAALATPVAINVEIIAADLPGAEITFTLGDGTNTLSDTVVLPAAPAGTNVVFSFADLAELLDDSNIIFASIFIDGSEVPALDIAIDLVQVPEPNMLALLGLGLAGVAFGARRRNAKEGLSRGFVGLTKPRALFAHHPPHRRRHVHPGEPRPPSRPSSFGRPAPPASDTSRAAPSPAGHTTQRSAHIPRGCLAARARRGAPPTARLRTPLTANGP